MDQQIYRVYYFSRFLVQFSLSLLVILLLESCSIFEESDTLPAFLKINKVTIHTEAFQGAATHKITDAWIAVEGQSLGVFPLPTIAPALFEQETSNVDFFAGIRNNGIREDAIIYPFYQRIELDLALVSGEEMEIPLEFKYDADTQIRLNADFETQNPFNFDEDGDGFLNMKIDDSESAAGNKSALIEIMEMGKTVEIATDALYQLPLDNGPIYLEMDYKGDMELLIGTTGIRGGTIFKNFFIVLKPQTEWNKIYLDLSTEVAASKLNAYRIILGARLTDGERGQVFVDNIKLLHF